MSAELDLCSVNATVPLRQAARHVMNQSSCESELKEELKRWLAGLSDGGGRENKKQSSAADYEYFNSEAFISFNLVVKIHQHLKINPFGW